MDYAQWFATVTGYDGPHDWQRRLAAESECEDRLLRIPTGMGKTEGVLAAWAWHRLVRQDPAWPRRLVWCLPMRVLVEQTVDVARRLLDAISAAGGVTGEAAPVVRVHALMGGLEAEPWHLEPERPAVFVGTQDMLLSRALNRGYAAGRARWPIEYALLNHDCLWVMDEVQLMDVGLATSVQLQAFRREDARAAIRPCHTWWMSATLQADWLHTVDSAAWLPTLRDRAVRIRPEEQTGALWNVEKPVVTVRIPATEDKDCARLARAAWDAHLRSSGDGQGRVTLVIVNRVETAIAVHDALDRLRTGAAEPPDLRLVHGRFRPLERRTWSREFLSRAACEDPRTDRIIVATQVVEAGVDVSGTALVTELAPWPSLVQRFGRAARYGGTAAITVVDRDARGKHALPYSEVELSAAARALSELADVGPAALERFEASLERNDRARLEELYPYEPLHVLTRRESDELFDTSPDLAGADLDISRFIRTGEERDVLVCWAQWDGGDGAAPTPPARLEPTGDGLCPVPVHLARQWLLADGRLKSGLSAWVWDYTGDSWRRLGADDCYPGQVILVDAACGGYDVRRGFTGARPRRIDPAIPVAGAFSLAATDTAADRAQSREDLSARDQWKTIATHGREVGAEARRLALELGLDDESAALLELAGRVHDWGKAHPAFNSSIGDAPSGRRPQRPDLAKAPPGAWAPPDRLYCGDPSSGPRRGFRHELASALALFGLLRQVDPDHEALLGPHRALIDAGVVEADPVADDAPVASRLADELRALSAHRFNLLAYLVCSHHGKARGNWHATEHDQAFPVHDGRFTGSGQPLLGLRDGDTLPPISLVAGDGTLADVPALTLHLDLAAIGLSARFGASWSERVHSLLEAHGPFALAFLEALLRAADVRASRLETPDPLLLGEGGAA
ncbi:MAG: DEAD/DEAH box helicase [Gemmatimonadetes bacterium]|nr:DEAD/DEAH box helicase [Gemmatimonadota bacterium]